jgi:hypothetical protein
MIQNCLDRQLGTLLSKTLDPRLHRFNAFKNQRIADSGIVNNMDQMQNNFMPISLIKAQNCTKYLKNELKMLTKL